MTDWNQFADTTLVEDLNGTFLVAMSIKNLPVMHKT